ncbi:16S rRNA (guanine(966)-N(2))-methyltransferase RsmD [Neomegalonema perideroedes]|uniref:16S rRNA (guanine(966)-N(2))-methyltransferase RsmD n=1 Tax=Neomegalonema perideroedes TaxID=217219 RepID=UPI00035F6019|nr:16S rRNA (guanine(966)-N(2))-methyltransferase RsmD [Neomegalonema perideroedes]
MRIVAGRWRGRSLKGPEAGREQPRPTSDRLREALFNILAHGGYGPEEGPALPEGRRVLDLFAGTGALGLEALSRGAIRALFVEDDAYARSLIRDNVEALQAIGESKIYRRDATTIGPCRETPFDLVFADPPYRKGLAAKALKAAAEGGWLAPGALIAVEFAADEEALLPPEFSRLDDRAYGESRIVIARFSGEASGS